MYVAFYHVSVSLVTEGIILPIETVREKQKLLQENQLKFFIVLIGNILLNKGQNIYTTIISILFSTY